MDDPIIPERKISGPLLAVIFGSVLALWLVTPAVVARLNPDPIARGQFGDLFGSINALFSGLAFAGVIVAILLQREELALQRHEIAANRAELARPATAQEESREALRRTMHAQAFKTAADILQPEAVRSARRLVLSKLHGTLLEDWSAEERQAAEIVCHTYDSVGIMVQHGMLPVDYIVDSWGDSIRRTWDIVQPLVVEYRIARESPEIWDDYEYLSREANARRVSSQSTRDTRRAV